MKYRCTKTNPEKFHPSQIKLYAFLIPIALFMLLPIIYIFSTAFKPMNELFAFPPRFFVQQPTMDNFKQLFYVSTETGIPLSRYLLNSLVISVLSVFLTIFICVSTGYMISKKNFKAKKLLLSVNTLSLMFVPVAVNIPRYLIISKLGLINNFWVHIIPSLAMPIGLFLVKQFIDQIPNDLLEAAEIDGANDFVILRKVIIPMAKPAIVTVAILVFQSTWNNADISTTYINSDSLKTFAFYMNTLTSNTGNSVAGQGMAAAAALIMILPNFIIFIVMQSQVMNTMAHSGIK